MKCEHSEQIGIYLDGELPASESQDLERHFHECSACRQKLDLTRALIASFAVASANPIQAPAHLWNRIETQLRGPQHKPVPRLLRIFKRPVAAAGSLAILLRGANNSIAVRARVVSAAASLAILLGGAAFIGIWVNSSAQVAQATSIDYRVLLDGLPDNVDASVARFLQHYRAEPMDVSAIQQAAAPMRFNLPNELPGGFKLKQAYRLQFSHSPGFAATYRRDSEPLFVFFHTPVNKTVVGVHRQSHCDVAGRGGQCVAVGPWQLIHFTDPTTCHCLLSRIEREEDLHAVLKAVSPNFKSPPTK
jgi:hypothetical protein